MVRGGASDSSRARLVLLAAVTITGTCRAFPSRPVTQAAITPPCTTNDFLTLRTLRFFRNFAQRASGTTTGRPWPSRPRFSALSQSSLQAAEVRCPPPPPPLLLSSFLSASAASSAYSVIVAVITAIRLPLFLHADDLSCRFFLVAPLTGFGAGPVRLLVTDFDDTITTADTTPVIIEEAFRAAEAVSAAPPQLCCAPPNPESAAVSNARRQRHRQNMVLSRLLQPVDRRGSRQVQQVIPGTRDITERTMRDRTSLSIRRAVCRWPLMMCCLGSSLGGSTPLSSTTAQLMWSADVFVAIARRPRPLRKEKQFARIATRASSESPLQRCPSLRGSGVCLPCNNNPEDLLSLLWSAQDPATTVCSFESKSQFRWLLSLLGFTMYHVTMAVCVPACPNPRSEVLQLISAEKAKLMESIMPPKARPFSPQMPVMLLCMKQELLLVFAKYNYRLIP